VRGKVCASAGLMRWSCGRGFAYPVVLGCTQCKSVSVLVLYILEYVQVLMGPSMTLHEFVVGCVWHDAFSTVDKKKEFLSDLQQLEQTAKGLREQAEVVSVKA
jgi:hypothetical protein